jgi:hypothetical protein
VKSAACLEARKDFADKAAVQKDKQDGQELLGEVINFPKWGIFMFCSKCGNKFGDIDRFCNKCGAARYIAPTQAPPTQAKPVQAPPTQVPPAQAMPTSALTAIPTPAPVVQNPSAQALLTAPVPPLVDLSAHPLIGYWELITTNEPEVVELLEQGVCSITQFNQDGTGMVYFADKVIAAGGQGSLYNQVAFTWNPTGDGRYMATVTMDGVTESGEAEFKIEGMLKTSASMGIITTDRKLPADFCITIIEDDGEKGEGIAGSVGQLLGGFLRGFLEE